MLKHVRVFFERRVEGFAMLSPAILAFLILRERERERQRLLFAQLEHYLPS